MKRLLIFAFAAVLFTACKKDNEKTKDTETETTEAAGQNPAPAMSFKTKEYNKKSTLGCRKEVCTYVNISVTEAANPGPVADSINNGIFRVTRSIVYFGEKPTNAKSYQELMDSFIKSYNDLASKYPAESIPWEAKIKATVNYFSDRVINIKLNNFMFTGGAHGYEGNRSLLFDGQTGRMLKYADIFTDVNAFTAFAEKKFREKFNIQAGKSINSKELFFENDKFVLPQNIFFTDDGLQLLYNPVEIGSFADGAKEVLIPFAEAQQYLKVK